MMVSGSQGGSPDDVAPGVAFFGKRNEAGNVLPVDPTPATVEAGQTPVVDVDHRNGAEIEKLPSWRVVVPSNAAVAGDHYRTIDEDAAHPAAARLWQEFPYGDEGQNPFLQDGEATYVSEARGDAAKKYLEANWAQAIG